ncbi:MAG: hypothetical protein VB108_04890 [Anaerolineaceae bacterium]|nr:hypothetical protein [Anaerolineaceae bacterium]
MIVYDNLLFNQATLSDALRAQLSAVIKEVDGLSKDQFLVNSDEQIIEYVYSKMVIAPLVIYRDQMSLTEPQENRTERRDPFGDLIRLPVIRTNLTIPYTGESDLWKMQPSTFTFNPPRGDYSSQRGNDQTGTLRFKMEFTQGEYTSDAINNEVERNLKTIEEYLGWIKHDIESHNPQLQNEIRSKVAQRRERLGIIQSVSKALNIPIQTREGAPGLPQLPLKQKIIQPLSSHNNRPPEYTISNEDYENILKIIRHEGCSYERTPEPFAKHDEEELRDILMAHLNGHYHGLANGEAFRKKGKTDICIEFQNRAAFVAECKLWKGEQKLLEAVTQLLGYLTWKDSKTALIVFDKDVAGFTKIQEKIPEVLKQHPSFVRDGKAQNSSEWQMTFRSSDDPDRFITIHVFLFNLFVNK